MAMAAKRSSYQISYKLRVVDYAKEHGNRAAARVFGPPPTEKIIRVWRQQEKQLMRAQKGKHNLRCPAPHWPELEDDIKTWVLDERNSGRSVSTKMIIHEAMRVAEQRGIQNFAGTEEIIVKAFKKCGISNALDGTEDDALFEDSDFSSSDEDVPCFEDDEDFSGVEDDEEFSG
ncbi:transposable element with KRAB [Octopus vulgaris]|uniref:Transposable element with KRAB n=1 Tax=Octopus vulgaris TaxID=6645 RepID=A0AA36AG76_OCTVU|nr:transposable element with KRAB [Octopus vulgaris]